MDASRRQLLSVLGQGSVVGACGVLLSACGFQLRQTGDFAFKTLYVNLSATTSLGVELRRHLTGTGRITLVTDPQQMLTSDVILDVLNEERKQVAVNVSTGGQVRELQLRLRVRFGLRTPQGVDLIESVDLEQQRDLSFSETAALSKEIEIAQLYRDMQTDIVQQILRRLSAVKPRPVAPTS